MIFDESTEDFLAYQESTFESPDLRPVLLPMSGYVKPAALEGMINLQTAGAAFPDSDAFGHYFPPSYPTQLSSQDALLGHAPELEPDYYSDGEFTYPVGFVDQKPTPPVHLVEPAVVLSRHDPTDNARKRKGSASPEYAEPQPRKRAVVAHLKLQEVPGDYHDFGAHASPFSAVMPMSGNSVSVHAGPDGHSPRFCHSYSTSNASQVSLPAPSPLTPAWSPSFTTIKTEHSPRAPVTPAPRPTSASSAYAAAHPKLVRTSTIPQQASPATTASALASMHPQAFNPYAMYPHNKATLRLNGDLDAVALSWSPDELENRRKLIVFSRSQTGSTIDADFKVVAPQDWQRGDITVNCIWWQERKEAFVTSVDTIALLEQLVAVRFTVEEKNRIRRNLEGFRPLTVSKAKPDSEEFFKVIMGFANPKPRNIEKDVKVFPWKILAHALKKIIGKYSASYSSTASTIIPPTTPAYPTHDRHGECPYPQPATHEGMSMTCYDHGVATMHAPVSMEGHLPGLPVHVPPMGPAYEVIPPGYGYETGSMVPHPMSFAQHPAPAPVPRLAPTWSYESFDHRQMGSVTAPPAPYSHVTSETADFGAPAYRVHG